MPTEQKDLNALQWQILLQDARHGETVASEQLWVELRNYVLLIAEQNIDGKLKRKVDASDIAQQTIYQAQCEFDTFDGGIEAIRAWLRKITKNNITDSWRQYSKTQKRDHSREVELLTSLIPPANEKTASKIVGQKETDQELLLAVQSLPERKRQIVELRHRDGLSYKVIADKLGVSEVAARKLWSRTIEELRLKLSTE